MSRRAGVAYTDFASPPSMRDLLHHLPGADLVEQGIADLRAGRESAEALLVAIGEPRLRRIGLDLPAISVDEPEHRLYLLLASSEPDTAHSRYNALIRRLVSFERAAECVASSTYDPYAQALAKIERGHRQDRGDVEELIARGLVEPAELLRLLKAIEPRLVRFPAVDPAALRKAVEETVERLSPRPSVPRTL